MSDESKNTLASEPPTNTGGGGNAPLTDDAMTPQSEPPTNTGGGGSSD